MGVVIPQVLTEDKASGAQIVDGSLRFDSGKGQYLKRTLSSSGNRQTWTWSGWVKKASINRTLLLSTSINGQEYHISTIESEPSDSRLGTYDRNTSNVDYYTYSAAKLRDRGWYHIVMVWDTSNSTQSERIRTYINGVRTVGDSGSVNLPTDTSFTTAWNNSSLTHHIGMYNGNQFADAYFSQIYFIDGQALGPEYFGYTDPLTNTWRPKKLTTWNNPNGDGVNWSNITTATSGFNISYPKENLFEGVLTSANRAEVSSVDDPIVIDFSSIGGVDVVSTLSIWSGKSSVRYQINDSGSYTSYNDAVEAWKDISFSGKLNNLKILHGAAGQAAGASAIRIDGVILRDNISRWGQNGFYLPLDGNTPIGQDQSGNGNNWTPVNFGGSNTLEKATGALPILNTDGGGKVARVGVRTDSNASSLVLALPLVGTKDDVSNQINSGSTTKTITSVNAVASSTQSNFYGGSASFNGSSSYLSAPTNSDFNFGSGAFTIEAWVNLSATGSQCIASNYGSSTTGWSLAATSSNIACFNASGDGIDITGTSTLKTGVWNHIAVSGTPGVTGIKLFVNGIQEGSTYTGATSLDTSSSLTIGQVASVQYLNGYIQDLRIYKGVAKYTQNFIPASTDPDILPDTPSGVAYSSNVTAITDGAVAFDGSGDYLSVADSDDFHFGSDAFTIEAYVYLSSTGAAPIIAHHYTGTSSTSSFFFSINTNTPYFYYYGNTVGYFNGGTVPTRKWTHVAVTRNGDVFRIFVDGTQTATVTLSGFTFNNSAQPLKIGGDGTYDLDGIISNFQVVKGTALYTSNFTPPTAPLTSVANTKLLCCQDQTVFNTGGQPILNTNSTGITTTSGMRNDPNASYLSLCLPMNGSNNGTTFTDQSPTGRTSGTKTFTISGDTKTVTSQFKFYGSSGYFDGTGDYLTSSSTGTDMTVGSGAFTIEFWVNFNSFSGSPLIVSAGTGGFSVGANSSGQIIMYRNGAGGWGGTWTTTTLSTGQWYHIVAQTSSGSGGVWTVYINGVSQGTQSGWSSEGTTSPLYIGGYGNGVGTQLPNAYIQDIRIYKGIAKYSSNFTVTAPSVEPIAAVSPSSLLGLGNAAATNFNPFTANINAVRGQESGYATLNPLWKNSNSANNGGTYANGNLQHTTTGSNGNTPACASVYVSSGKWYWEAELISGLYLNIGVASDIFSSDAYPGYGTGAVNGQVSWGYISHTGNKIHNSTSPSSYGSTFVIGDIIGVAMDLTTGELTYYKNGVSQGVAFSNLSGNLTAAHADAGAAAGIRYNFGQKPFKFPPPSGFQPLALANTPRPTIVRPDQYVGIVTYSGNGSTQTISGLGFSPDLVWIKARNTVNTLNRPHQLFDTVRGAPKALSSNRTDAEDPTGGYDNDGALTAFTSNGFTVENGPAVGNNGSPYVAWAWKAGGNSNTYNIDDVGYATASAAGLTAGTITPTGASVNTTSGFSIVRFAGPGSAGFQSVPHGLGKKPKLIICKDLTNARNWGVYHESVITTDVKVLILNSPSAVFDSGTPTWDVSEINSTIFTPYFRDDFGASYNANNIAYCWAEIPGFSKFGSYTGNGSADGPFVYTEFRPRWILTKATNSELDWNIFDAARDPYNSVNKVLFPNLSNVESDYSEYTPFDFLSNGFKLRTNIVWNASSTTYIYAAFAEAPSFNLYGAQSNAR